MRGFWPFMVMISIVAQFGNEIVNICVLNW